MANAKLDLPVTEQFITGLPEAPEGFIGAEKIAPVLKEIDTKTAIEQEKLAQSDLRLEQAKREEKATEAELRKGFYEKEKVKEEAMPERVALRQARENLSAAKFEPTKDTVKDIAGLFSLMGVVGMVVGKQNALQGMYAMNGMMEGHIKGRRDLVKQQALEFDKNFKVLQAKVESAKQELEEAQRIRMYDLKAGEEAIAIAVARSESPFIKESVARVGIQRTINILGETKKTIESMVKMQNELIGKAKDRALREEDLQLRRDIAELKAGMGGRPLKEKEASSLEGLDSLASGLEKLKKDFKPEYAGLGVLGFGADAELEYKRRLGDKKGQEAVSWWSRYQQLQAPNRHALFGGTLTGNELKNYQSFTAKPSDGAKVVENFIQDQIDYTVGTASGRRRSLETAGFKVPESRPIDFVSTYSGVAAGAPQAQIPRPTTEAEFNALPKGSIYIDPEDGKQYRK